MLKQWNWVQKKNRMTISFHLSKKFLVVKENESFIKMNGILQMHLNSWLDHDQRSTKLHCLSAISQRAIPVQLVIRYALNIFI